MNVGRIHTPAVVPASPRQLRDDPVDLDFAQSLDRLLESPRPTVAELAPAASAEIKFSRHAAARLTSRGIEIGAAELSELTTAVDRLSERGARESLVLLGDNAFVVGVPSRTVITAMPRAEALGTVFTKIDSTFVAR